MRARDTRAAAGRGSVRAFRTDSSQIRRNSPGGPDPPPAPAVAGRAAPTPNRAGESPPHDRWESALAERPRLPAQEEASLSIRGCSGRRGSSWNLSSLNFLKVPFILAGTRGARSIMRGATDQGLCGVGIARVGTESDAGTRGGERSASWSGQGISLVPARVQRSVKFSSRTGLYAWLSAADKAKKMLAVEERLGNITRREVDGSVLKKAVFPPACKYKPLAKSHNGTLQDTYSKKDERQRGEAGEDTDSRNLNSKQGVSGRIMT